METTHQDPGLGEALASYQPTSMSRQLWDRLKDDATGLVLRLEHRDGVAARQCLSRLVVFLADVAPARPNAELDDLLTSTQVEGHLQRALASGDATGTVQNRQGALNKLLRAKAGRPPARQSRSPEPHLAPYDETELRSVVEAAVEDGSDRAACLARTILCALAGHELPRRGDADPVEVEVADRVIVVGECRWRAPAGICLPDSGQLDHRAIERGRRWGRTRLGFALDRRRLALTFITRVVAHQPAATALQLPGVGRDRLTAAVAAADRPPPQVRKAQLRGTVGSSRIEDSAARSTTASPAQAEHVGCSRGEASGDVRHRPSEGEPSDGGGGLSGGSGAAPVVVSDQRRTP